MGDILRKKKSLHINEGFIIGNFVYLALSQYITLKFHFHVQEGALKEQKGSILSAFTSISFCHFFAWWCKYLNHKYILLYQ